MEQMSAFKALGVFSMIIMLLIWIAPAAINSWNAFHSGDYKKAASIGGGRLFVIDNSLHQETDYLLKPNTNVLDQVFHIVYSLILLFMLFFFGLGIYKVLSTMLGEKMMSLTASLVIILFVIAIYSAFEFFYSYYVLKETIFPLKDGVFYFIFNIPKIFGGLVI